MNEGVSAMHDEDLIRRRFWQAYCDVVEPRSGDSCIDVCVIDGTVTICETPGDRIDYWPPIERPAQPSSLDDAEVGHAFRQAYIDTVLPHASGAGLAVVTSCDAVEIYVGDEARRVAENVA